jgi:glyoxylase-like metal-dependent hydrolase (beta-lactamase superfamily II)
MVHLIDALHLGRPNVISIGLLEAAPKELVIVDTGPESVFDTVVAGVRKLGFDPNHVRHILASHIHLDHTGAAWRWAKEYGTNIYVHPKGAPHLVDPSRLLASATRIYGDKMNYLWGAIEGAPNEQVIATEESELQFHPWTCFPSQRLLHRVGASRFCRGRCRRSNRKRADYSPVSSTRY